LAVLAGLVVAGKERGFMGKRAKFVVIEGVDHVGKTTQLDRIEAYLRSHGVDLARYREPGGTKLGERIRELLLDKGMGVMSVKAEILLFFAARAQLIERQIEPALDSGQTVVLDRYYFSSAAYQGIDLYGSNWTLNLAQEWLRLPEPDLVIYLDGDPEVLVRRAGAEQDRIEERGVEFQKRVRQAYQAMVDHRQDLFRTVNAERSIEEVWKDVERILESEVLGQVVRG
jgi:dTMP kinase